MCSLLVHNTDEEDVPYEHLHKYRGSDGFSKLKVGQVLINHYLLSIKKGICLQPFYKNEFLCAFNGEVYNKTCTESNYSETEFILDAFLEHKFDFIKHVDGEFLIFIYDVKGNKLHFFSDTFGIKPLFYYVNNHKFIFSSIRKTVDCISKGSTKKLPPNSHLELDLYTNSVVLRHLDHGFNFIQKISSYELWYEAFLNSIEKRFSNCKWDIVVPLSSGHDSGAIVSALNQLNIKHHTMTFEGEEHIDIIKDRLSIQKSINKPSNFKNILMPSFSNSEFNLAKATLTQTCDFFTYGPKTNLNTHFINGHEDPGAVGKSFILNYFRKNFPDTRIMASGHGPDELMSNIQTYTFGSPNPKFFDQNLADHFPWENVFEGSNMSYLSCDEAVCGGFSYEGRYPFLDREVVQSYLNLTPEAKNAFYKAPIRHFLEKTGYPFVDGESHRIKKGFNSLCNN